MAFVCSNVKGSFRTELCSREHGKGRELLIPMFRAWQAQQPEALQKSQGDSTEMA
jgi:hypothetical protein